MNSLSASDRLYVFFAAAFVGILLLTNVIGTKLFVLFPETLPEGLFGTGIILTTGVLTYPLTFWFTDVVSEIWGKARADMMVIYGFLISLIMLGVLAVARAVPPAEVWQIGPHLAEFYSPEHHVLNEAGEVIGVDSAAAQASFTFTFEAPGILLFASMLAYLTAQLLDNYLFHFWRRLTGGKHLWLRNNGSTLFSQLADTIIVNGIFLYFYWGMPWFTPDAERPVTIVQVILTSYIFKLMMAVLDTPLIYLGVYTIRRIFGKELPEYA